MTRHPQCEAIVAERPHYIHEHRCPHPGRYPRRLWGGRVVNLCGIHNRVPQEQLRTGGNLTKEMIQAAATRFQAELDQNAVSIAEVLGL